MKTNKLGDWIIKTGIIFIFIFIVLLLIINYQYNRMDRFVDEIDLSKVEGIVEKFNCEIKYKDFYYNGFCVNNDAVWKFLEKQYNESEVK